MTARVKILELPERAQQLIGDGVIALAAVDQLRAIGRVAPALLDAVIAYLDDGNAWAAERLTREPGWVLDAALRRAGDRRCSPPTCSSRARGRSLSCGWARRPSSSTRRRRAAQQLDRYAYGPPPVASPMRTSIRRAPPAC